MSPRGSSCWGRTAEPEASRAPGSNRRARKRRLREKVIVTPGNKARRRVFRIWEVRKREFLTPALSRREREKSVESDGDDLGAAGLFHGDAVHHVGGLHGALVVGDRDELRVLGHLAQQAREAVDVGFVER